MDIGGSRPTAIINGIRSNETRQIMYMYVHMELEAPATVSTAPTRKSAVRVAYNTIISDSQILIHRTVIGDHPNCATIKYAVLIHSDCDL